MAHISFAEPPANTEGGKLSQLWRLVVVDNNYFSSLNYFVTNYLQKTNRMNSTVVSVKRKNKSTLFKNISASEMTIKTLLDLLFNLIEVKRVTILLKLTLPTGRETVHSVDIDNSVLTHNDDESNASMVEVNKVIDEAKLIDKLVRSKDGINALTAEERVRYNTAVLESIANVQKEFHINTEDLIKLLQDQTVKKLEG